ncbi:MAG: hypothetical protein KDA50_10110 [Rhodobacteraceae bacterium]|nr:hypothetical protein [Paracoccaceae bacterium]
MPSGKRAGTKIATCCYCGTRAALTLKGGERHELSCATCGAPLHNLKGLKLSDLPQTSARPSHGRGKPGKRRKGKSLRRKLFSSAVDMIEDLLD